MLRQGERVRKVPSPLNIDLVSYFSRLASPTSAEMAKEVHGPTMCIESPIQSDLPCQKVTDNSQPLTQVALLMQGLVLTLVQP